MSIQSEITRIKNNITSALSVCAAAGVSVAADANSDDLPSAVTSLANSDIDCGTFTDTASGAAVDAGTF